MKSGKVNLIYCVLAILLSGCQDDESIATPIETFSYTFEQDVEGWEAGIADYPKEWDESRLEFVFAHEALPPEVAKDGMALSISGSNISDDLFMFLKKRITGLEPNMTYNVTFDISLASKYPEKSVGIGGSPGASVFLKAGGATSEPKPVEVGDDIRMNIDKGNQSQGGKAMVVLGSVGIPGTTSEYRLINRDNARNPVKVITDSNGSLWVIVGTDSGFEGVTKLYFDTIKVSFALE